MSLAQTRAELAALAAQALEHLEPAPAVHLEVPQAFSGPVAVLVESTPWVLPAGEEGATFGHLDSRWELALVAPRASGPDPARAWLDAATWAAVTALTDYGAGRVESTAHLTVTHRDAQHRAVRVTFTTTTPL